MPSNPAIRNISRDRLMAVFKDADLVKLFEAILYGVGTTLPANIDGVTGAADAAQATASSAQGNLNLHLADPTDAHDASSISVVPTGTFAVTDVQSAIALLASMAKQAANAVAITGGAVNNTPIGAATPSTGKFTTVEATSIVRTDPVTVAALPTAASVGDGSRAFVTDATATTFLSPVVGGGTNKVPVVTAGGAWVIG